jgi:hypothetical protein
VIKVSSDDPIARVPMRNWECRHDHKRRDYGKGKSLYEPLESSSDGPFQQHCDATIQEKGGLFEQYRKETVEATSLNRSTILIKYESPCIVVQHARCDKASKDGNGGWKIVFDWQECSSLAGKQERREQ